MDQKTRDFVTEQTKALMAAPSCCAEAKAAAQAWLGAAGTAQEAAETKKYLAELAEDITPIDGLIAFAESKAGIGYFGAAPAKQLAAHAREIKAAGAKYCDCPACVAAGAILAKKDAML